MHDDRTAGLITVFVNNVHQFYMFCEYICKNLVVFISNSEKSSFVIKCLMFASIKQKVLKGLEYPTFVLL